MLPPSWRPLKICGLYPSQHGELTSNAMNLRIVVDPVTCKQGLCSTKGSIDLRIDSVPLLEDHDQTLQSQ